MLKVLKGLGEYIRPGFIIAFLVIIAATYLWISGQTLPETLESAIYLVLAFYFGEQSGRVLERNGLRNNRMKGG